MQIDAQAQINSVAFAPDGRTMALASERGTIDVWSVDDRRLLTVLEGHTASATSVSFAYDGAHLASRSTDGEIRIWRCDPWHPVGTVGGVPPDRERGRATVAFHPRNSNVLTSPYPNETVIPVWELDQGLLHRQKPAMGAVRYTTAKVVLVGDSGVGKTGLGWRLAHNEFREHSSTHGQQFWVVNELNTKRPDGTECEAVVWDLAGQHIYRSVHAIFLEDVDVALVLFDATNRQDPLKGVQFWLEQLAGTQELPPAVLVGARSDRGLSVLSKEDLERFCRQHRLSGGFVSVSALNGDGLPDLLKILKRQIRWDLKTATITTATFKRIKEFVLDLKEQPDRGHVLVNPADLRARLEATDGDWQFTDAEMMVAVKHLENHGYVAVLRGSSGDESVLLAPELLGDLASSIVLQADKHPRELGALNESDLLRGRYPLSELVDLAGHEHPVLLDAAVGRFVNHNLCFRETLGADTLLIFPGLIKQKRPLHEGVEMIDGMSYIVRGRVENVYAALVVLLGYTQTFTRINQWQHQAQYEFGADGICGFRLLQEREGEIELVLFHSASMPKYGLTMFQGLFETFLHQREVDVAPFPPVDCSKGHRQERATVIRRSREHKDSIFCDECGEPVPLTRNGALRMVQEPGARWAHGEEAVARLRSAYETHLVRVKGFRRDRAGPRCRIDHNPYHEAWVAKFAGDLREAGIIVLDEPAATAIVNPTTELAVVSLQTDKKIPLRLTGQPTATPYAPHDFRDETYYPVALFDVVLELYGIPLDHPAFGPLRDGLRQQWSKTVLSEQRAATLPSDKPLNVFISYAHQDETFKDELATALSPLQRRRVIHAWQDRQIEPGDEWRTAIETAINECDLAVLLISPDFLASRFIQEAELPSLLQRREKRGLRILPIVVRPCLWDREPVLHGLQALPGRGKTIIDYVKETGARDQIWTDVARSIEARSRRQSATGEGGA